MDLTALTRDNPKFVALERAYRDANLVELGVWDEFERGIDMQKFRGESFYLAQLLYGNTESHYWRTYDYCCSLGLGPLIERLGEDNAFGCITFERRGVTISRDLLDSVLEIDFLNEELGLATRVNQVLDIGAGYGRFAYRLSQVYPNSRITCVDAVPVSTFLCHFYLKYRNCKMAIVEALDTVAKYVKYPKYQNDSFYQPFRASVGVNIHSFSEMPLSAIDLWVGFAVQSGVKDFFIVPHDDRWICSNPDGSHPDFRPVLESHGFRCVIERPKYPAGVGGAFPTVYSLWRRE